MYAGEPWSVQGYLGYITVLRLSRCQCYAAIPVFPPSARSYFSPGAFLMPLFSGAGRAPGPGPGPFLEVPPLPAEDTVVALLPKELVLTVERLELDLARLV